MEPRHAVEAASLYMGGDFVPEEDGHHDGGEKL